MAVLEFFNKRVRSLRRKFTEVAEAVGKKGGISTDISTLIGSAKSMMEDIGPIIGKAVPQLSSTTINGVVDFIENGSTFIKNMYDSADFDFKPIADAVLATGIKESTKAVSQWVSTAVGATEITAADNAQKLLTKLSTFYPAGVTEAIDSVDSSIYQAGGAATCDGQIARQKIDAVLKEVASLSPSSQVVYEASFNPIPGEVHLSREDGVSVSADFPIGSAANGFGVGGSRLQDSIAYATPFKTPNYTVHTNAANRIATFRMTSGGALGLPKMTSFNYEVGLDLGLHMDFGGVTAATDAQNLGSSGLCNYAIFAGPVGAQVLITTGTFAYDGTNATLRFLDVDIGCWIPASASPIAFDIQIQGDTSSVVAMTGSITIEYLYGYHIYGKTKSTLVPRSDVTYELAGFTGSKTLGDENFLEFMGKLQLPDGNDPMTVNALWLSRISKATLVREVCGWLDTETYANKKYVSAGFAGGISDVARVDEWLDGVNGPFAGMSSKVIKQALVWFWQDLNVLANNLDVSASMNVNFAIDNGFCGDSVAN
jgi:hypothetical protein